LPEPKSAVHKTAQLRILFSVRNPSYVRHYDPVLRTLASRGHQIELASERPGKTAWPASVLALAEACPGVRLSETPTLAYDRWWELATRLRQARFYLRFLEPSYGGTPGLLTRARERAPALTVRLAESVVSSGAWRRLLLRAIDALELSTRSADPFADIWSGCAPTWWC
jgi:hypothetical protein